MIMVAAISPVLQDPSKVPSQQSPRPPLLPSEKENGVQSAHHRRFRAREVPSRYMSISSPSTCSNSSRTTSTSSTNTTNSTSSSSTSSSIVKRFPSPVVSRNHRSSLANPKRSQSVDRRRSVTPKPTSFVENASDSAATKLLVTSIRRLSVSFQGESFSLPISRKRM